MGKRCRFSGPIETSVGERMSGKARCPGCGRVMKIALRKNDEDGIRYLRYHNEKELKS